MEKNKEKSGKCGLKKHILDTLQEQISVELKSSHIYLAMSNWLDYKGYFGAAKLYKKYSNEERNHMLKLCEYLQDRNYLPITPSVVAVECEFTDLKQILDKTIEHEIYVTSTYKELYQMSFDTKDELTMTLCNWYLNEQIEEEAKAQSNIDRYELYSIGGITGLALAKFDEELGELA